MSPRLERNLDGLSDGVKMPACDVVQRAQVIGRRFKVKMPVAKDSGIGPGGYTLAGK